jgi:arylsulfatase A-like enzyme
VPLRGGKGWLYEGGIREPLIVRWPGVIKSGTVIDAPVSSPDFFPTLMELAGASAPAGQPLDGTSLVPLIKAGAQPAERPLFWHYPHYGNQGAAPGGAVREGNWKLIEWYEDGRRELFNVSEDLSEERDLAAQMPEKVTALAAKLDAWRKETGALMPTQNPEYDPAKPSGRASKRRAK